MKGVVPMVHSIASERIRPSAISFQKAAQTGFSTILAGIQEKSMSQPINSTQNGSPQNIDEEALQMLNELVMNTLVETGKEKVVNDADGLSVNDFVYGLMEQLRINTSKDIKQLEDIISQVKQYIENPLSIDSANLLEDAQLQRLADVEQLTADVETKPSFAATYILLKELGKMVPNAHEQLKRYQQEANGKSMPSIAQMTELITKMEDQLQSLKSRALISQTDGTKRFHPLMNVLIKGKHSSQQLINGQTLLQNRVGEAGLIENQLIKPTQSVNLVGNLLTKSPIQNASLTENTVVTTSSETSNPVTGMPMSKAEQFILHMGQTNGKVDSGKVYQEFYQILTKSSFAQNGSNSKLTIRLTPEHLGPLHIELIKQDQVMIARMVTSTQQAKELLESQLLSLKQALMNAQIQVERIDIQQQFQLSERFMNQSDHQQNQSNQHSRQNQKDERTEDNEEQKSFLNSLEEELLNINV
ncbi:MAG TPA: flagellar hook-length control protein FliK [Bacillus sp. (in: firmicutes)]|nr:flagellar hook-length control protein FliK [Bacillus sp. (in: firmicutes)]